ncbi:S1 RNA-binding domain-containing protein [Amycolatopsis sp. NPDC023774]|uniref:S1 RNA-binding domain-containing protein n=1 Tax=Amycolatopsis sp. NPDC023774 TaxID=3155015 RepID=UPI0033F54AF1
MVHTSELDESPDDVTKIGDFLAVKILDVDPVRRRITLSHKQALAADAGEDRRP